METEKMYYLDKFCCICMNKSFLKHLFEVDSDGVSHYNKLTSSIAEMNFKEMNDQRLICGECCVTLNTVYDFRQMCLRSKTYLITQHDHVSGFRVGLKEIKPELIVVKNRGGSNKKDSNGWKGHNPQIKFQTESSVDNIDISTSVKEECENGDDDSSAHEDATVDHVNEGAHSDVKVEDVEHKTMVEDYSKNYVVFNKIEIEEHPLEEVKEEPMSDTETPQDSSTSQAATRTSEEPKGSEETTIVTKHTRNTEKGNDGLHLCEICQKSFHGKNSLDKHAKKHFSKKSLRPYECEICKKGFEHKRYLTKHMRTQSKESPFECEICKRSFYFKCNLTVHMMKTHSSVRPYECEICKKGFKYSSNLTEHMKTHSSERQYVCEICKKGFNYKSNLTVHMKKHSSERPYECEICKKGFKFSGNLKDHAKTHIGKTI